MTMLLSHLSRYQPKYLKRTRRLIFLLSVRSSYLSSNSSSFDVSFSSLSTPTRCNITGNHCFQVCRHFSESSKFDYHVIADTSLEELLDLISVLEKVPNKIKLDEIEINLSQGVLKLELGSVGTWVINKQSPNKQLWWSSPLSGPRRYEYVPSNTLNEKIDINDPFQGLYTSGHIKYSHRWRSTRDGIKMLESLRDELISVTGIDISKP